ncbi:cupin domain-containing protein [Nostoc sp. C110]|uniref:cupin domain-containing protein n=1 Tax=Nostoc sp. C110 TaxID=3349876 RepID=UPI00370D6016
MADPRFNEIFTRPENGIFHVVFFPDRIYHAQYLNATRSPRYRYNVQEVRGQLDINVLKGEVYLDGKLLCNFLRVEYRASRLIEQVRIRNRFVQGELMAYINLLPENLPPVGATIKLRHCPWIDAYQVEIWETLEPPLNTDHDVKVLDMMGNQGSITRISAFNPALKNIKQLKRIELAFRENDRDLPFGFTIGNPAWDNNFGRSFQVPNTQTPSSSQNTVDVFNYLIDFQRGWYLQADKVNPVRYLNAMMNDDDPERASENIIEMRWLLQREFGSSVVFFHEVIIPPGKVEGTHQHIGSEELYYIVEGEGIAYMGVGDDPQTETFPTVTRNIFGIGLKECKELPVKTGSIIFTKSGGIHGIRNPGTKPLKFVAFLYHSS